MPYIYSNVNALSGELPVGSGDCVALVKQYSAVGNTMFWRPGVKVLQNHSIQRGTAIATFENGRYPNRPVGNHAAFYLSGSVTGFWVMEQFHGQRDIRRRFIRTKGKNRDGSWYDPSNNAEAFFVIETQR